MPHQEGVRELEVELTVVLDNDEWSASHPCCFILDKKPWYIPWTGHRLGCRTGLDAVKERKPLVSAKNRTTIPRSCRSYLNHYFILLLLLSSLLSLLLLLLLLAAAAAAAVVETETGTAHSVKSLCHRQNDPGIKARFPPGSSRKYPDRPYGPFPASVGHVDNYTSTFPYVFLVSCSVKHTDNFTQCYRDYNY